MARTTSHFSLVWSTNVDGQAAVDRIKEGLGFLTGTDRDAAILLRLKEAQRELEKGKSLPKFLLQEDQILSLAANAQTIALPTGFLRVYDDGNPRFLPANSTIPVFLKRVYFKDGVLAYQRYESGSTTANTSAPKVYAIRKSTIDFLFPADQAYTLYWSYYKAADEVALSAENAWLANIPEWLIGDAGRRIALSMRDADAVSLFTDMRDTARAAYLSEVVAEELADGPLQMGAQN